VSNSRLVFQVHDPQGAHGLDDEIVELVGVGATTGKGNRFATIHTVSRRIGFDESIVARLLDLRGNLGNRLIPRNVFPFGATRSTHLWFQEAPVVQNILLQGRALRTERATIDGVVGIAFDVNHLRGYVLGAVANGVNDDAATHRTVGTRRARLIGSGYFQDAERC